MDEILIKWKSSVYARDLGLIREKVIGRLEPNAVHTLSIASKRCDTVWTASYNKTEYASSRLFHTWRKNINNLNYDK